MVVNLEMGEDISPVTAETSPEAKVTIESKKIGKKISALKKISQWPKEGTDSNPSYDDESATIYLQCTPRNWQPGGSRGKDVSLPHPLSYNRSVCLIVSDRDMIKEKESGKWTTLLKQMGVEGEITVTLCSDLQVSIKQQASYVLEELAKGSDVHFADMKSIRLLYKALVPVLYIHGRNLNRIDLRKDEEEHFTIALAKSPLMINFTEKFYAWKVGHTGHTDIQIQENIQAVLKTIGALDKTFPGGVEYFRSIQLKTGSSDSVTIYVNDKEPEKDSVETAAMEVVTAEDPSSEGKKKNKKQKRKSEDASLETPEKKMRQDFVETPFEEAVEAVTPDTAGKKKKKKKKKNKKPKAKSAESSLETSQIDQECVDGAVPAKAETPATPTTGGKKKKKKKKSRRKSGGPSVETPQKELDSVSVKAAATPNTGGKKKNKAAAIVG